MTDTVVFQPRKPIRYKPRPAAQAAPTPPPPPAPVAVLSAVAAPDGQSLLLTFSAAVSVYAGATPDVNFLVGEQQPASVAAAGGTGVTLAFPGGIGPGDGWTMSAQPNWLLTAAVVPQAGEVG